MYPFGMFFVCIYYRNKDIIMANEKDIKKDIQEENPAMNNEDSTQEAATEENKAEEQTAEEETKEKTPEEALAEAEQQIAELKDKYLRTVAEFDNYKKRTIKEKAELILNGSEKTVNAILPILDDMERAIANADKAESAEKLEEGWELIAQKFIKVLGSMGVKKIETEGKDFDVDFHEAIAMVPGMGDDKKGKIIDCVLNGYTLNDKVIRHAKVAVGQ